MNIDDLSVTMESKVTPKQIYGERILDKIKTTFLTEEFKFDFPKFGEMFVSLEGNLIKCPWDFYELRLILLPPKKHKYHVFKETGEVRFPKKGEWYIDPNRESYTKCPWDYIYTKFSIFELTIEER